MNMNTISKTWCGLGLLLTLIFPCFSSPLEASPTGKIYPYTRFPAELSAQHVAQGISDLIKAQSGGATIAPEAIDGIPYLSYSELYSVKIIGANQSADLDVLCSENSLAASDPRVSKVEAAHFTMFAFDSGTVDVEITCGFTVNEVVVRPTSYGITPVIEGNVIRFRVDADFRANQYIDVEVNGYKNPLFLFAEQPEQNVPNVGDASVKVFEPGDHRNDIIDPAQGETVAYFKSGIHLIGKQYPVPANTMLYIAPGAILLGNLSGYGQNNIKITGRGILSCSIYKYLNRDGVADLGNFTSIGLWGANNVLLDGPTVLGNIYWNIAFDGRDGVVKNLKIMGWEWNTDGVNVTYNAQYSDLFLMNNDDELRIRIGAKGAVIQRAVVWHIKGGNVFVDDRMEGPIQDIEYRDIDIIRNESTDGANNFSIRYAEAPAYMSNVRFININFEDVVSDRPFYFNYGDLYPWYLITPAYQRSNMRDVLFSGINVPASMPNASFAGLNDKHTIENLYFNNYKVGGNIATDKSNGHITTNNYTKGLHFNQGMLALTSPNYNDLFETGDIIHVSASVYEFDDNIDRVDFLLDGMVIASDTDAPYTTSIAATKGMHTLLAKAYGNNLQTGESSKMPIGVGENLLQNGGFEDTDISIWQPMEESISVSRLTTFNGVSPAKGVAMALISGNIGVQHERSTYGTVEQDVTEALKTAGPGTYGLSARLFANGSSNGEKIVLEIIDDMGTHIYDSRGIEHNWQPTIDKRFQTITWKGELKSARIYILSNNEDSAGEFPTGKTKLPVLLDDIKLCHIDSTDIPNAINDIEVPEIIIYPNPTSDYLRFTNYNLQFNSAEILDITGKLIYNKLIYNSIDVSGLSGGVYLIKINTDKGSIVKKFIKN